MTRYIYQKTFQDVKSNQDKLIEILNHSISVMKRDIGWIKKIQGWQVAMITAIFISLIGILIKSII